MAITMLNPDDLFAHDFLDSHLWEKMKSLILCAVSWDGKNSMTSKLLKVVSLDFHEGNDLVKGVQDDYDFIRNKLKTQGYGALTGKDGVWIQTRTKGAGHGSTTRAFYARKCFLETMLPPFQENKKIA